MTNYKDVIDGFRGKRIFVTWHTGFKGTWMTYFLNHIGADVMGYALEPETEPSHFSLLGLERKIHNVYADIRDKNELENRIKKFKPEIVFHLAAQAIVRKSYSDPVSNFETNVMGSMNLLEAVRSTDSVRSLVYITSDKCYENQEWIWGYRENDLLGGYDPYSASKAAAEIVFSAYSRSYFQLKSNLGYASARAGNVIGGGDWSSDRIIPDCIRAIGSSLPIKLRNPNATRPWQHVLEPISGYLLLAYKLYSEPQKFRGSWNFGPSSSEVRTVYDVSKSIIDHFGKGSILIEENPNQQHEAMLLQLNCDKAHQFLNWFPRWNVDKTLEATAVWYKLQIEGNSVEEITTKQLREYFGEWK